ncbi:unnamed protein product [Meloidogyne enterolobii]|uniref:Uncharacterized protein n=1 Tax=Meloidogyne enterolobii TaxID=390850 RepID=A0ACB0ZG31_MELEN
MVLLIGPSTIGPGSFCTFLSVLFASFFCIFFCVLFACSFCMVFMHICNSVLILVNFAYFY